jgi:hypothetical protein
MADATTYQGEIGQAVHRPGMEGVVNRGGKNLMTHSTGVFAITDDPRDQSGNRQGPRRTVSPPTRSAFGPDSASDPAPKEDTPAAPSSPDPLSIRGNVRTAQNLQTADDASK